MSLQKVLKTAIGHLRGKYLENTAQIKQAVILPILRTLDWEDSDPTTFKPEYSVGHMSVDFGLLYRGTPQVLIKVQEFGDRLGGSKPQLLRHATIQRVPILILTDGNRWDFHLPMAEDTTDESGRFFQMELALDQLAKCSDAFEKFLGKGRVVSGKARMAAESQIAATQKKKFDLQVIADAWRALVDEPEGMLRLLLVEEAERKTGNKPEPENVEEFLKSLTSAALVMKPMKQETPNKGKITGFIFEDERKVAGNAIATLAELLKRFHRGDPEFMERFAHKAVGRTRQLIARQPDQLYADKGTEWTSRYSRELVDGWWLGTNYSGNREIRNFIKIACEVARVKLGTQVRLIER